MQHADGPAAARKQLRNRPRKAAATESDGAVGKATTSMRVPRLAHRTPAAAHSTQRRVPLKPRDDHRPANGATTASSQPYRGKPSTHDAIDDLVTVVVQGLPTTLSEIY